MNIWSLHHTAGNETLMGNIEFFINWFILVFKAVKIDFSESKTVEAALYRISLNIRFTFTTLDVIFE